MDDASHLLSAEEMRQKYGSFFDKGANLHLYRGNVPNKFWPLIPYAEFWGVADDVMREELVKQAPPDVRHNLKAIVAAFDNALDEWLAGSEADDPNPSDEYVAFSAMRIASYSA